MGAVAAQGALSQQHELSATTTSSPHDEIDLALGGI